MPYAITLRLDAEAASFIEALWRALASRGISDEALRLGYPPHLTLAVYPDSADRGRLIAAARGVATHWRALPITLASLGVFPGTPATLFLAPVVTPALLALHAELLSSLVGELVDAHYQLGHWVPHVTLASDLANPATAIAALDPAGFPIVGVLDTMEAVRFRPVQVLESRRLADA